MHKGEGRVCCSKKKKKKRERRMNTRRECRQDEAAPCQKERERESNYQVSSRKKSPNINGNKKKIHPSR